MFRTLSDRTTALRVSAGPTLRIGLMYSILTFIFANVFQGEGQTGILSLDDANLAKGTFSHHSQESKMVEVDCCVKGGVSICTVSEARACGEGR